MINIKRFIKWVMENNVRKILFACILSMLTYILLEWDDFFTDPIKILLLGLAINITMGLLAYLSRLRSK